MKLKYIFALVILVMASMQAPLISHAEARAACTSSQESCSERFKIGNSTFQVWRNYPLTERNTDITHAIVMVHGRGRNPGHYLRFTTGAAELANRQNSTLVISPYFRQNEDHKRSSDLYWKRRSPSSETDWAMGGASYRPESISSFAVLDEIINYLANTNRFPNLKSLTVAGNSAGGQVAHRYALAGNPQGSQGLRINYVIGNPSSYAYLGISRPHDDNLRSFHRETKSGCSWYNKWGYGLARTNDYVSDLTRRQIIRRYRLRYVTYLIGEEDTGTRSLDQTCAANAQGENRYERARGYYNYVQHYYPTRRHELSVVPDSGHDGRRLYQSKQGLQALFRRAN